VGIPPRLVASNRKTQGKRQKHTLSLRIGAEIQKVLHEQGKGGKMTAAGLNRFIEARKHFGPVCIKCGKVYSNDMHHDREHKQRLVPICRDCHKKIHNQQKENEMSDNTDKKITAPGIYAVSVRWTSEQQVGAKQTPAIKLLLVSEEHGKIYATIWNSEKARSGEYMRRICEAFAIPNIPPESADDFADKQCNIVVNINDRGYPEVDAYQPYDPRKETTAGEPEPEPEEHQTTQEYLDSIKAPEPQDSGEEVPF
jgi:hypothetical protein